MRILVSVLLLLVFVQDYSGPARVPLPTRHSLRVVPVDLYPGDPSRRTLGNLTYLGGVELHERGPAIGGYSGLVVAGDRFTLLSDIGTLLRFRLTLPDRLSDVSIAALPDGPGTGWQKRDRDAEAIAIDPATGTTWIAFENDNEIWRYAAGARRATGSVAPRLMREWSANNGAETLVRMRDGSFVVLAETWRPPGEPGRWHKPDAPRLGLRYATDPVEDMQRRYSFVYVPPVGYDPVDATELPDGRMVVLNRAFGVAQGFTAKLTIFDAAELRPGARIRPREIATLAAPTLHDNFEGVAATQERGATILWLVSDDNQLPVQRTLLLKFRLNAPRD